MYIHIYLRYLTPEYTLFWTPLTYIDLVWPSSAGQLLTKVVALGNLGTDFGISG